MYHLGEGAFLELLRPGSEVALTTGEVQIHFGIYLFRSTVVVNPSTLLPLSNLSFFRIICFIGEFLSLRQLAV